MTSSSATSRKLLHSRMLEAIYRVFRHYGASPVAGLLYRLRVTSNQVTLSRLLFVFVFAALQTSKPRHYEWLTIGAYLLFAYTDLIDGVLAQEYERKNDDWGTLADSLADKIFVCSVYWFYRSAFLNLVWFTLSCEFLQVSLVILFKIFANDLHQEFAFEKIKANIWGKTKALLEFATCLLMIIFAISKSSWLHHAILWTGWTAFCFLIASILDKAKKITS